MYERRYEFMFVHIYVFINNVNIKLHKAEDNFIGTRCLTCW